MSSLRVFIALEISSLLREKLGKVLSVCDQATQHAVKWVTPQNIHITVKFLGNIQGTLVRPLQDAMIECSKGIAPITVAVKGIGSFPGWKNPRIIWVGLKFDRNMLGLYESIETQTTRMGFSPESRPFVPHLTLGRVKENADPVEIARIKPILEPFQEFNFGNYTLETLHIFKSDLHPSGPVYSSLAQINLHEV